MGRGRTCSCNSLSLSLSRTQQSFLSLLSFFSPECLVHPHPPLLSPLFAFPFSSSSFSWNRGPSSPSVASPHRSLSTSLTYTVSAFAPVHFLPWRCTPTKGDDGSKGTRRKNYPSGVSAFELALAERAARVFSRASYLNEGESERVAREWRARLFCYDSDCILARFQGSGCAVGVSLSPRRAVTLGILFL